jgi:hypothetical protein
MLWRKNAGFETRESCVQISAQTLGGCVILAHSKLATRVGVVVTQNQCCHSVRTYELLLGQAVTQSNEESPDSGQDSGQGLFLSPHNLYTINKKSHQGLLSLIRSQSHHARCNTTCFSPPQPSHFKWILNCLEERYILLLQS